MSTANSDRDRLEEQLVDQAEVLGIGTAPLRIHLLSRRTLEEILVWLDSFAEDVGTKLDLPSGIVLLKGFRGSYAEEVCDLAVCYSATTTGCVIHPGASCEMDTACSAAKVEYRGHPWGKMRRLVPSGGTDLIHWR